MKHVYETFQPDKTSKQCI